MATRVVLVGINSYPEMPLRGCLNDVATMGALLQQRGIAQEQLHVLRDAEATRERIVHELRWLATLDAGEGPAVRLFHFSGHGTYVVDTNGDEPDGRDEALVPYDYKSAGALTDDMLRAAYSQFDDRVHLLLTMDCCHSGTITRAAEQDIVYRFMPTSAEEQLQFDEAARQVKELRVRYVLDEVRSLRSQPIPEEEMERRVRAAMATFDKQHFGMDRLRGNVVLLAACRADQTAADAKFGDGYHGAFTYYLAEVLREAGGDISYQALITSVGQRLFARFFTQLPQLECSDSKRQSGFLMPGA